MASVQLPASAADATSELNVIDQALRDADAEEAVDNELVLEPLSGEDEVRIASSVSRFGFGLPAEGVGEPLADGMSTMYEGSHEDTTVVVQPVESGARALVLVLDEAATTTFDFPVVGDTESLHLEADGAVTALDAEGFPVATAQPAWAVDAKGEPVPTRYEVEGTTLRQVVDHQSGDVAYPVTADPVWTVVIAAAARSCATGALAGVSSTALVDIYKGRASRRSDYVLNAVASCLVGPVGYWTWKFLPGATKRWAIRQVLYVVIYVVRRVR